MTVGETSVTQPPISDVVTRLRSRLGAALTANLAGASNDQIVRRWMTGAQDPVPDAEARLRAANDILAGFQQSGLSPHTVHLWFVQPHRELGGRTPVSVLRDAPAPTARTVLRRAVGAPPR